MMSICQKCGDKGWSVALIYCNKCQIYAQHRYCLDVLPKTFSEYVVWHCESCSSKVLKATEKESSSSTKSECQGSKFQKVNQLSGDKDLKGEEEKDKEHVPCSLSFINEELHDEKHERDHRRDLSYCLGSNKQVTNSKSGKDLKWKNKEKTHMKTKKKKKRKKKRKELLTQSLPLISEELPSMQCETDLNMGISTKGESLRPEIENPRETSIDNTKLTINEKKKQVAVPPPLAPTRGVLPVENPKIDQKLGTGVERSHKCNTQKLGGVGLNDKYSISGETAIRNRNTFEMANGDMSHMFEPNLNDPSRPIFEPVWKGSFIISHNKFGSINGIGAHLSTKAIIPVHREAKLLPEPLRLELVLRSNVWPKGFGSSGPKDDSIGLYFFPQNQRDERAFDRLVEYMIEADLAIRARAANSELLVFTSQQLPLPYWRFQARYYLWGAFRGNREPSSRAVNRDLVSHRRDSNAVTPNASIPKERLRPYHTKNIPEVRRTDRVKNLDRRSPHGPLSRNGSHRFNT